jgi:4-amino-4-deoxy-L-arabinose transferase-like glycosyltransferase
MSGTAVMESRAIRVARVLRCRADSFGIGLSALCMIHCLAFPVLIAFAPAALRILPGDDATHRVLAVCVGLAGGLAFRSGYKVHGRRWILALFFAGMALIVAAALVGEPALPERAEAAMTVCGGVLLVTAHWQNRTLCRSCIVSGCHPAPAPSRPQPSGETAGPCD